jgi:hypothetical protein
LTVFAFYRLVVLGRVVYYFVNKALSVLTLWLAFLFALLIQELKRILLLGQDSLHVAKLLLQSLKHLFAHLKLDGTWMMLNSKRILAQILNKHLVLGVIVALAHLKHHILVRLDLWLIILLFLLWLLNN